MPHTDSYNYKIMDFIFFCILFRNQVLQKPSNMTVGGRLVTDRSRY